MFIKNFSALATTPLRRKALLILEEGYQAAQVSNLMKSSLHVKKGVLTVKNKKFHLADYQRIFVIGGGKASSAMAYEVERLIGKHITVGVVNDVAKGKNRIITTHVASHPIPDERGLRGVQQMLELTKNLTACDLVICLLSGGGSALMPAPCQGLTLSDLKIVNRLLVASGASIHKISHVRKHISNLAGGRLAQHLYPASVITLILSDVIGDTIDVIASGPTVPDSSTYADALRVLKKYSLTKKIPAAVLSHLQQGRQGHTPETPKKGNISFKNVHNFIIGNNLTPLAAMSKKAQQLGFKATIVSHTVQGDAARFGKDFINQAKPGFALIAGGETTVTAIGKGKGGRCQHMALSVLKRIPAHSVFIAAGSDGSDHSDKAGVITDAHTLELAKKKKLNPKKYLTSHDSYTFFKKIHQHITTGPTGTNVMDFYLLITE